MSKALPIKVELKLLSSKEGGRQSPIVSGYRGTPYWENMGHDGIFEFEGEIIPGDKKETSLRLLVASPEEVPSEFEIREGLRVVARARRI